jgi:putative ABC transport system permease protein
VYALKDAASIMPDPQSFGIFMIPQNQAQQLLNYTGQINQVVITLTPGTDEKLVADKVKRLLSSYGNLASYPANSSSATPCSRER